MPEQAQFFVGWGTLSLINAGLAQSKGRSGLLWWLISLFIGPIATFLIVVLPRVGPGPLDNPIFLANRKVKALRSLLKAQAATKNIDLPWMDAVIFLSADDVQCDLTGPARNRVFLKDQKERKGIIRAITARDGQGIDPNLRTTIDIRVAKAISRAMESEGIHQSQRLRRVGDYILGDLIADGPGYQDRLAQHVAFKDEPVYCRVRQYTVAQASDEDARKKYQRAATREFQILQTLNHSNT